ncbi:stage V sporulation protein AC [Aciduricibacillus chroicocephali]|uniref:Stage V sporulation protein AC n=1 Tax=Aciduricibacillus chroicocephali TaxID=3054939 RepID=A0ABY9KXW6_9BACI|nr:stage V sporulation protein AC [Bacillaceae bacterium 44XB]
MAESKKQTKEIENYKKIQDKHEVKKPVFKNCLKAFLIGGIICLIGQCITAFYIHFFDFTEETAGNPTVATLIFLTMLATGFGVYDRLAQIAGAGTAVPVTGFGNAVISSAIEHRTEGYVLGVGSNMLKLAGPVIVYGVFSAFIIGLIKAIFLKLGGM